MTAIFPLFLVAVQALVPSVLGSMNTTIGIHPHLTYPKGVPSDELVWSSIASKVDFVWNAASYSPLSDTANMLLGQYMTMIWDVGSNGSGTPERSLDCWRTVHPDWILYKCDKKTPAFYCDAHNAEVCESIAPLDFTNPDVIKFLVRTYGAQAVLKNLTVLSVDLVQISNFFGACGHYSITGEWVPLFTGEPNEIQFVSAMGNWFSLAREILAANNMQLALIASIGFPTGANATSEAALSNLQSLLPFVDGIYDEQSFTNYGTPHNGSIYPTAEEWEARIAYMVLVQQYGKSYALTTLLGNASNSSSTEDVEWVIASYLLGKLDKATVWTGVQSEYFTYSYQSLYDLKIGYPCVDYSKDPVSDTYYRLYSGGYAVVNADPQNSQVFLLSHDVEWTDFEGQSYNSSIVLSPHSGKVLLSSVAQC